MPSPLTLPVRYTRHQPPAEAPIRSGHPLARGLSFCAVPSPASAFERLTGGAPSMPSDMHFDGVCTFGNALRSSSITTSGAAYAWNSRLDAITDQITLIAWVRPDNYSTSVNSCLLSVPANATGGAPYFSAAFYANGSNVGLYTQFEFGYSVGGAFQKAHSTAGIINPGDPLTMYAVVYDNGTVTFYRNGLPWSSTLGTSGGNISLNSRWGVGLLGTGSFSGEGVLGLCGSGSIYSRALSSAEVFSLYVSPFQMF